MAAILVVAALVVARWWVPRLPVPRVEEGDEPPRFDALGDGSNLVVVATLAAVGATTLWHAPPSQWPAWIPYVVLGAPLINVDRKTTYLPNSLMYPLLALCATGLAATAGFDAHAALRGTLGAAAGFAMFWLVWRMGAGLGFGDVRLAIAVGAVAGMGGATQWMWSVFLATAIGATTSLAAAMRRQPISAYGPALWLGPIVATWIPLG